MFKKLGGAIGAANHDEMKHLKCLNLDSADLAFYGSHFPKEELELNAILLPLAGIISEMNDAVPGVFVKGHGYIPIARSYGGDLFCINTTGDKMGGGIQVVMFRPGSKNEYGTADKIVNNLIHKCFGIKKFYSMCFDNESIDEE